MLLGNLAMTMAPALGPSDSCRLQSLQSMQAKGLDCRPALAEHIMNGFILLQSGIGARRKLHYVLHDLQSMLLLFLKKQVKSAFLNTVQGIVYCRNPSCVSAGACGAVL